MPNALTKIKKYGLRASLRIVCLRIIDFILKIILSPLPLKNIIVFETSSGLQGNSGTFYRYLLEKGYSEKYKFVYLTREPYDKPLTEETLCFDYFSFNLLKIYYIHIAKLIMYDSKVISSKRNDQTEIYLTHGAIPLKNAKGLVILPKTVDFLLSPSEEMDLMLTEQRSCGVEKMIHVGFPVLDNFCIREDQIDFPEDKYDKVILWMPTFRRSKNDIYRNDSKKHFPLGLPLLSNLEDVNALNSYLEKHKMLIIVKFHPVQDLKGIPLPSFDNLWLWTENEVYERGINLYRLFVQTNALISDYSSVAFDYMLLDKPIGYVLDDEKEYMGFAMDNYLDYMPGSKIYSMDDLYSFLGNVHQGVDEFSVTRNEVKDKVFKYGNDGKNCERLLEFLKL